ncbi:hypothetical protein H072_2596 [Dactylellina haptotyla CBS 200.50]|uniref:Sister chromatid cohesion protein Dcc1 n=1 Tax=Dactylellina haptotyla (strain CBS 200.50) TaxID=1284197 RepID=S8C6R4_DACHA|nr:hypothetical protein H072_2596 [Dactylellina haptotyla CBS 200.50]
MSTQDETKAIPLAFAHEQSPVRLIELPPSLLSLIENSTFRGSSPVLKIKASPSTSADGTATPSNHPSPFAVLTTDTETYNIRSVHSSNSIFLLNPVLIPTLASQDEDSDTEMSDNVPAPLKPGVVVASTCGSHLELLPSKPNTELLLQSFLTEYISPEHPPARPADVASKSQVAIDTPVSDAEFKQGWIDATCFEIDTWAVRLAPSSALQIFKSVINIMYAVSGSNTEWSNEGVDISHIMEAVENDGELEDWPADAIRAVVRGSWESKKASDGSIDYIFNAPHAAKWVGKQVLLATPNKSFRESEFMSTWKESVPADCTDLIELKMLDGLYTQSALGVIRYIHGSAAVEAGTSSAASKKKKWHEKFAAGKKK